jgi:Ca2+-binding RTX toxin-like protein
MPRTLTGRALAFGVALITGGLMLAGQAQALTEKPVWKCRASAGYTTVNGGDRAELVVANGNVNTGRGEDPDHALCASGEAGGGNLPAPLRIPTGLLTTSTASAVTTVEPPLAPASAQRVRALGRVEKFALQVAGAGTPILGATLAEVTATGACRNGVPQIDGASRVTGLTLNGTLIDMNTLASTLTKALNSLRPLVDVKQNEMIRTADALTIRALHIVVRLGSGLVIDTVVAEAKVGVDGMVCADPPPPPNPCPQGSVYVESRNLCIIPAGTDGSSLGEIIVGRPFQGPSGGRLVPVDVARRRYRSPCLSGPGSKFAQVGNNRSNELQGTRLADRIIALGGSDRVAATRGNDCVDGGRGNDNLSGDVGNDRIYGATGNDRINGGPGNDRIQGGRGNDTVNAAYGADRIAGGSGRDYINIATAGPIASANCGSGYDKIRFNRRERKHVHACEKRYMLND